MTGYLMRHACAGHKETWPDADSRRPLDPAGLEQAALLGDALAGRRILRLWSSPADRCVQTLRPLADARGLTIQLSPSLSKHAPPQQVIDMVLQPDFDESVLCTHGETLTPLIDWLTGQGVAPPDGDAAPDRLLAKGTAWAIDVVNGRPVSWNLIAPLTVRQCPDHLDPV